VLIVAMLGRGLVDPEQPVLHADDLGLDRGDGCFEGIRVLTDIDGVSQVDKLDAHLARFARSAASLQIEFDETSWRALVATAVDAWTVPGEATLRLLLTRGRMPAGPPTGLLTLKTAPALHAAQRRDGLRVVTLDRGTTSDGFADRPWLLGGVKTLSYAVSMAAYREAARRGADDVIFVSVEGQVLEAPTSTVVWALGRTLYTVPLTDTGILAGTTQRRLFDRAPQAGWRTAVTPATVHDLHAADTLWLISSGRGPVDVIDLDGKGRARDPDVVAEVRQLAGF
jgi:4-amino-4-deoxychorismate lyase